MLTWFRREYKAIIDTLTLSDFALYNEYEVNEGLKVKVYNSCQFPLSVNIYVCMWMNMC